MCSLRADGKDGGVASLLALNPPIAFVSGLVGHSWDEVQV